MANENETNTDEVKEENSDVEETTEVKETTDVQTEDIDNSIDYEEELKREREAREKAERALADKSYKEREQKRKTYNTEYGTYEEEMYEEEDKPLTAKQLQEVLVRERQETQKMLQESTIKDIVNNLAESDAEKELVMEIHRSRVFPQHLSVREQVEEAYAIANRKKLIKQNDELKRALANKSNVNTDVSNTHQDSQKSTAGEPAVPAQRKQILAQTGFKWNNELKRYEKELPGGAKLVHNIKTGTNTRVTS